MADGGRREKEGKSCNGRGSGAIYRPESSWVRRAASGGGWFGPGKLNGGLAERAVALRMAGRCGGSGGPRGACPLGEVPRGRPGGAGELPWVHLAVDAPRTSSTSVVRRAAGETEHREERDGGEGLFVISENPGTSR